MNRIAPVLAFLCDYTCKHIYWVCLYVKSEQFSMQINNEAVQRKFYLIATGSHPSSDWLQPLFGGNSCSQIEKEFVVSNAEAPCDLLTSSNSNLVVDNQQLIEKGTKIVEDISHIFIEHLNRSPAEVVEALDSLFQSFKKIKTVAGFTAVLLIETGVAEFPFNLLQLVDVKPFFRGKEAVSVEDLEKVLLKKIPERDLSHLPNYKMFT